MARPYKRFSCNADLSDIVRIALLSIRDPDPVAGRTAAPLRTFAGMRVIDRQLDLAVEAGCTVVVCFADGLDPEALALQHRAEDAGARFLVARDAEKLIGLGTAKDELFVIAPGLLPDAEVVTAAAKRPAILTLPAETALPLGYERIDAQDAWAGVMVARASLIEHLAAMPADCDAMSALLRLALQTGERRVPVDPSLLDRGEWQLWPDQEALDARAARWVGSRAGLVPFSAPGQACAERAGLKLARDLIGRSGARVPVVGGLAAASAALAASTLEWPLAAQTAALLMTVLAAIAAVIGRVTAPTGAKGEPLPEKTLRLVCDPVLVVALAAAAPEADGWLRLYVPAVLLASLTLAQRGAAARWRPAFGDRVLLSALFVPAVFFGISQGLAALFTALALAALLFSARDN